jgi:hypothetical protein
VQSSIIPGRVPRLIPARGRALALVVTLAVVALPSPALANRPDGKRGKKRPPTVRITAPAPRSTLSGTATWKVSVSGIKVRSVWFFIDSRLVGRDSSRPYRISLDSTKLANGPHRLKAAALTRSRKHWSAQRSIKVANIVPPPPAAVPAPPTTSPPPPATSCAPPYDKSSPWDTPIAAGAAVDPKSAVYMQAISDNGQPLTSDPDQYTIPVYRFDSSTPHVTVTGSGYYSTYDSGDNSRVGHDSPWSAQVPVPFGAIGSDGSDGQIILLDLARGIEYGFWQFAVDSNGHYTASNGYRYHTSAGYGGRFADGLAGRGAGTPYLAGLVRPCEIAQGQIDHALAFAYDSPSSAFVYPASKSDGGAFGGVLGVDLPEGSRLQLDPSLSTATLTSWGLSPAAIVIARALQRYGMYVVDHSGSSKIYLEDTTTAGWSPSIHRNMLSGIPWSAFRVLAP